MKDGDKLDFDKILVSLESFTKDKKKLKPKSWPSKTTKNEHSAAENCRKMPLRSKHSVVHDGYTYVTVGGESIGIYKAKRAVFIPSLGRYNQPLFDWTDGLDAKIVVFVAWYELMLYEEWRTNDCVMFLTLIPHVNNVECIGFARLHIFKFAQNIGRKDLWMIDDSVPVKELKVIERAPVELLDVFAAVEEKMDLEEKCLLMGINTTYAIQATNPITLADNRYHLNRRTPTSMVHVYCGQFTSGKNCPNFYLPTLSRGCPMCSSNHQGWLGGYN